MDNGGRGPAGLTWTGKDALSPEAHNSIGVTSPEKTWYLPEGSTNWGFECWLLIQNPGNSDATCQVTYMIEGGSPVTVTKHVAANTRATFDVADDIGANDASIKVTSDVPVIPERAMYRNQRREGHDSIGTTQSARDYFLAEGTSAWGYTTYVLIQNPNTSDVEVQVSYLTSDGTGNVAFTDTVKANTRKTYKMNDRLPNARAAILVNSLTAGKTVNVERSMYWNSRGAGTDTIGGFSD